MNMHFQKTGTKSKSDAAACRRSSARELPRRRLRQEPVPYRAANAPAAPASWFAPNADSLSALPKRSISFAETAWCRWSRSGKRKRAHQGNLECARSTFVCCCLNPQADTKKAVDNIGFYTIILFAIAFLLNAATSTLRGGQTDAKTIS